MKCENASGWWLGLSFVLLLGTVIYSLWNTYQ